MPSMVASEQLADVVRTLTVVLAGPKEFGRSLSGHQVTSLWDSQAAARREAVVEVPPARVVDPASVAEIEVFEDEYSFVRVAKVTDGGVAADDEIVEAVPVVVGFAAWNVAAGWVVDEDCCEREDGEAQKEGA